MFDPLGNMEGVDLGQRYQQVRSVGTAQVYEAFDTDTQQKVSVKVIKSIEDTADAKRALREIRCLRVFRHPNIQGLLDVIELP